MSGKTSCDFLCSPCRSCSSNMADQTSTDLNKLKDEEKPAVVVAEPELQNKPPSGPDNTPGATIDDPMKPEDDASSDSNKPKEISSADPRDTPGIDPNDAPMESTNVASSEPEILTDSSSNDPKDIPGSLNNITMECTNVASPEPKKLADPLSNDPKDTPGSLNDITMECTNVTTTDPKKLTDPPPSNNSKDTPGSLNDITMECTNVTSPDPKKLTDPLSNNSKDTPDSLNDASMEFTNDASSDPPELKDSLLNESKDPPGTPCNDAPMEITSGASSEPTSKDPPNDSVDPTNISVKPSNTNPSNCEGLTKSPPSGPNKLTDDFPSIPEDTTNTTNDGHVEPTNKPPSDPVEPVNNPPDSTSWCFWNTDKEKKKPKTPDFSNMPLDEKRKYYRCGNRYLTLDKIETWPEYVKNNHDFLSKQGFLPKDIKTKEFFTDEINKKVSLWQGDITWLEIDAIVNAANKTLLGGGGVDGCIHRAAGKGLLDECRKLNGCDTGSAKMTSGHKLPAKNIIHTVGPIGECKSLLESCYNLCLDLMKKNELSSMAFCCISTGIYGYPYEAASKVALETVRLWLDKNKDWDGRIIFCVFLQDDLDIYEKLMLHYFPCTISKKKGSEISEDEPAGAHQGDSTTKSVKMPGTGTTTDHEKKNPKGRGRGFGKTGSSGHAPPSKKKQPSSAAEKKEDTGSSESNSVVRKPNQGLSKTKPNSGETSGSVAPGHNGAGSRSKGRGRGSARKDASGKTPSVKKQEKNPTTLLVQAEKHKAEQAKIEKTKNKDSGHIERQKSGTESCEHEDSEEKMDISEPKEDTGIEKDTKEVVPSKSGEIIMESSV
ncbi:ADP-ribose glycohydrolase MACROD2-like isoform X2 [Dendronephthya gigantea]|uniref:ADP-ribose glycohydrolase MACROD2-like isoform X2 n=1 Tax=Dendronephthya gigantea TaxID=151771 RepID=UPI00106A8C5E|nr:ADP-ribose glycohydrolase MACROD2-like isoform X2 [Dendronephthya gigantea]